MTGQAHHPIPTTDGHGGIHFASLRLGLELHLAEDTLRFFDPTRAEYLATADEHQARADKEAERAEAALRRVAELETALRTAQR